MSDRNFYELLHVSPTATPVAIRKAYKKAMLRTHPDKAKNRSPSAFIAVQKAYKTLGDESSRRRYDAQLRAKRDLKRSASSFSRWTSASRKKTSSTTTTTPPTKPYVGIRIAIMLDGRWVKGFLKAYEESSTRSVSVCVFFFSCFRFFSSSLTGNVFFSVTFSDYVVGTLTFLD